MISGQELYAERDQIKKSLNNSNIRAYENGNEAAEKTRAYRMILSKKVMELKNEGIQISILKELAKGSEEVANAEFEMNVAEVKYKASNENIMIQKKLLDSIEADINREYHNRGE